MCPQRSIISNHNPLAILRLLFLSIILGLAACDRHAVRSDMEYRIPKGDGIVLIDTDAEPIVTDDNHLIATLQDGHQVKLAIRGSSHTHSEKSECSSDFYEDIGSLSYIRKMMEEDPSLSPTDAEIDNWRQAILERRESLREDFRDRFTGSDYEDPQSKAVNCNLKLHPEDRIYMRLDFEGSGSSGVTVDCMPDRNGRRARIVNPATTTELKSKDVDPPMLYFKSTNCGIEPLTEIGDRYIDELGAVKSRCDPVSDVTIKHCQISGRITAGSLPNNLFKLSMVRADHVDRLRQSATQHINFSDVKITGRYKGAIHFLPGVHHVTIEDSELYGGFINMTIHLPADGGWNIIKNNKITGQRKTAPDWFYPGKKREVISIDSSEHNRIVNNYFKNMPYGAIKLYRNCGEKNNIRHRTPQYTQIINNVFDYEGQDSSGPTIMVGSRDDISFTLWGVKRYCGRDLLENREVAGNNDPKPWDTEIIRNSSESNDDWAEHNVIADNQVINKNVSEEWPYRFSSKAQKLTNYLITNEVEYTRTAEEAIRIKDSRGAGCAVLAGITDGMESPYQENIQNGRFPYLRNGWSEKYFWDFRPEVRLTCDTPLVCDNNVLSEKSEISCQEPTAHDYGNEATDCNARNNVCTEGSNAGDEEVLGCPGGGTLLGVQVACNLEYGKATDAQRMRVPMNQIRVVKPSDDVDNGLCTADATNLKEGKKLVLPWLYKRYQGSIIPNALRYFCKERDRNGGECHVNIRHYCVPPELI